MMHPIRPNIHSLVIDAGESVRAVIEHYPAWIQSELPGYYYKLASLDIRSCIASDRWQTLSQWEGTPGLYGQTPDGLGTM